ncbi:MAG: hypothetical protein OXG08_00585 [Gammaproteobacteria bacterium]|nr:hypothetical protein [Gammaproteobacteria bacterium]
MRDNSRTKRTRRNLVQFVGGFAVTCLVAAGGFFFIRLLLSDGGVRVDENTITPSAEALHSGQAQPSGRESIPLGMLDDIGSIQSGFERAIALDSYLVQADANFLKQLFVQSKSITPTRARETVQEELLRRFATTDPVQALDLLRGSSRLEQELMLGVVFHEWASTDLDSARKHASTLEPYFLRQIAYGAMLEVNETLTTSETQQIARHLELTYVAMQDVVNVHDTSATKNHEEIWNATLTSSHRYRLKYSLLVRLAQRQVEAEGLPAIDEIGKSQTDWRTRKGVLRESIKWAARSDPRATFEFALGSFRETDSYLVMDALEQWVQCEPENALSAISSLETSRLQKELYSKVVASWSDYEPRELLRNLELLPENLRVSAQRTAFSKIRDLSAQEVTQLVAELPEHNQSYSIRTILGNWKNYAFEEALDWVMSYVELSHLSHTSRVMGSLITKENFSLPDGYVSPGFRSYGHRVGSTLIGTMLSDLNAINAELVFERILDKPLDDNQVGLEADVVMYLVYSDVDAAIDLLPRIRNEKTRIAAIQRVGGRLGFEEEWEKAGKFGSRLPKPQRSSFYDSVVRDGFDFVGHSVGRSVVETVAQIPYPELRSRAALWAIESRKARKNLSASEETSLRGYLTDEDKEEESRLEITITH